MQAMPGGMRARGRGRRGASGRAPGRWRRRGLLGATAALFVASIPWYREAGAEPALWLGLPDWVAVALACYVGVALLNAWAWLEHDASDVADDAPHDEAR